MDVTVLGSYLNVWGLYCENPWYYRVCEDYNGAVSKVLGDGWLNPRILSVQSLEAHQRVDSHLPAHCRRYHECMVKVSDKI